MKRYITIIILGILPIFYTGCSKDTESFTTYPSPDWSVKSPEQLPNSFTAIVAVPDEINVYATDTDKMAAFIGDECRGVGTLVKSDDNQKRVYYLTIRASDTDNGEIVFKYYNARLSYMYQATQTVSFVTDGTYGTYDSPVVLDLKYL